MSKRRPKAPAGCYWHNGTLYARYRPAGGPKGGYTRSLHTSDPRIARQRFEAWKSTLAADVKFGDGPRSFDDALVGWQTWITRGVGKVGPNTHKRYAVSLGQMQPWLEGRRLTGINHRLLADIVRLRSRSVTRSTIKRDLVALSSVMNFAISQGWLEANPVLPLLNGIKERKSDSRLVLPSQRDLDLMVTRAPGMIGQIIALAVATGARQAELLTARRDQIDRARRQMVLTGKGNKSRTIDLVPFGGFAIVQALPVYVGKPGGLLFWHSAGEGYKNFSSQFNAIGVRLVEWAKQHGTEFRKFRFHDLRHLHAIRWLKAGGTLEELQHRLGHDSIKTTEGYCARGRWQGQLTFEEEQIARGRSRAGAVAAPLPAAASGGE